MIVPVRLNKNTTGSAMIDSGASTQFIDLDFAVKNNLPLTLKTKPETLIVVDGREGENQLTHTCTLELISTLLSFDDVRYANTNPETH